MTAPVRPGNLYRNVFHVKYSLIQPLTFNRQITINETKMKKIKKRLLELLVMLISAIFFFFVFRYWDPIKEFIVRLF
jgi:hypothetical protein